MQLFIRATTSTLVAMQAFHDDKKYRTSCRLVRTGPEKGVTGYLGVREVWPVLPTEYFDPLQEVNPRSRRGGAWRYGRSRRKIYQHQQETQSAQTSL